MPLVPLLLRVFLALALVASGLAPRMAAAAHGMAGSDPAPAATAAADHCHGDGMASTPAAPSPDVDHGTCCDDGRCDCQCLLSVTALVGIGFLAAPVPHPVSGLPGPATPPLHAVHRGPRLRPPIA